MSLPESIGGRATSCQEVRYGERLASVLGTQLQRISGGKHFTPEDHPDAIATAITEVRGAT